MHSRYGIVAGILIAIGAFSGAPATADEVQKGVSIRAEAPVTTPTDCEQRWAEMIASRSERTVAGYRMAIAAGERIAQLNSCSGTPYADRTNASVAEMKQRLTEVARPYVEAAIQLRSKRAYAEALKSVRHAMTIDPYDASLPTLTKDIKAEYARSHTAGKMIELSLPPAKDITE